MHDIDNILQSSELILTGFVFIIGLFIGSFLNVVIYRLPVMMEQGWKKECTEYLELEAIKESAQPFNLFIPGSKCGKCQTAIKPYQNIPFFSYLLLAGKCAQCKTHISLRYPIIETFTAICSAIVAWQFGYSSAMFFALLLTWSLIALSFIDIDHQLLPDSINLPVLWLGLLLSVFSIYTDTRSSIIGAIVGYLSLWTVYQLFKLATGKEGMGYGDFKLLALFGAWLGWQYLPIIILLSSLLAAVIGIAMVVFANKDGNTSISFGPYIAVAGWLALVWGEQINGFYLRSIGM
ncbi:MAG: prepilin peptidase [Methylococcales symbiont of Hymedesmia sp. n. MRB-2018]|nr:MAG: prepilin peptidase [Methylococcales symbiont of Hymedesmia sp. n. MRB-2018]